MGKSGYVCVCVSLFLHVSVFVFVRVFWLTEWRPKGPLPALWIALSASDSGNASVPGKKGPSWARSFFEGPLLFDFKRTGASPCFRVQFLKTGRSREARDGWVASVGIGLHSPLFIEKVGLARGVLFWVPGPSRFQFQYGLRGSNHH